MQAEQQLSEERVRLFRALGWGLGPGLRANTDPSGSRVEVRVGGCIPRKFGRHSGKSHKLPRVPAPWSRSLNGRRGSAGPLRMSSRVTRSPTGSTRSASPSSRSISTARRASTSRAARSERARARHALHRRSGFAGRSPHPPAHRREPVRRLFRSAAQAGTTALCNSTGGGIAHQRGRLRAHRLHGALSPRMSADDAQRGAQVFKRLAEELGA